MFSITKALRSRLTESEDPPAGDASGAAPPPSTGTPAALTFERLETAIAGNELSLFYLPKIDVASRRTVGVEALLRWQTAPDRFLAPLEFVPFAESTGLIRPLTRWVLREAVTQLARWRARGLDLEVSVNLSVHDLEDPELTTELGQALGRAGIPAGRLALEIGEVALFADPEAACARLHRIRGLGVSIMLDDFSTAYDSLPALPELPLASLKIDRDFVMGMARLPACARVVQESIGLAHRLGLRVTAEGVYSRKVFDLLAAGACDEAQGFYVSAPQPVEDITFWLETSSWGVLPGAAPGTLPATTASSAATRNRPA